jgi:hypothetical protein
MVTPQMASFSSFRLLLQLAELRIDFAADLLKFAQLVLEFQPGITFFIELFLELRNVSGASQFTEVGRLDLGDRLKDHLFSRILRWGHILLLLRDFDLWVDSVNILLLFFLS